eukprot:510351_1
MTDKETNALLIESNQTTKESSISTKKVIIYVSIALLVLAAIIILVVFLTLSDDEYKRRSNEYYEDKFLQIPSNDSCYSFSKQFASKPHVAGMQSQFEIGLLFAEFMKEFGFDSIQDDIPNCVLSHYNASSLSINGEEYDLSQDIIDGQNETNTPFRFRSWLPYSSSGIHSAPLLYINTASQNDFDYLINNLSIDLDNNGIGYIGVAKHGSWADRANQALQSTAHGLKGLILFENWFNDNSSQIYPNGPEKPNSVIQMDGQVRVWRLWCSGNPDPDRIKAQCSYDFNVSDRSEWLDEFPAIKHNLSMLLISPNNAIRIFELMNNAENYNQSRCNDSYFGSTNLPINSCIGGSDNIIASMMTSNEFHTNDTLQNFYGYFKGSVYPNEIVMIGAHRDAWGFGACDDISGTVSVLEIARSLSVLRDKYKWRPKRSILFGSWDGEEWDLFGSTHFNEDLDNGFIDKIVAYFNFDMTVVGGNLEIMGNPMFRQFALDSAKDIDYPYPSEQKNFTLFDTWWDFNESAPNNLALTHVSSDFGPFEYYSGIPCLGPGLGGAYGNTAGHQFIHTFYDLNGFMDVIDPKWYFAQTIAQYGGLMLLRFAQNDLIPFDVTRIALKMSEWTQINGDLRNFANNRNCLLFENYIDLLIESTSNFQNSANIFTVYYYEILDEIQNTDINNYGNELKNQIENINNILSNLFTQKLSLKYPNGLPSGKWYKQMIFGPPWSGNKKFPYIWDIINDGCIESELLNAFNLTVSMIDDASDLLMSFI